MAIELQGGNNTITYANSVLASAQAYISRLASLSYSAPTISVTWNSLVPPTLPAVPDVPDMPVIEFNTPTPEPAPLNIAEPTYNISDFGETSPTLNLPATPVLNYGTAPLIPDVAEVTVPTSPVVTMPPEPTYLALNTITFSGLDLHEDWLDRLEDIPTLTLASPTPFTYTPSPEYESNLLSALKGILEARMLGGTGLPEAVEAAIWDRARDRETKTALANEAEIQRQSEALGFQLPSGVMVAQMRDAQKNYYDKVSELSRDIAIKQAELEQANMKDTVAAVMQLENTLIDSYWKAENLSFQAAKELADNAVQIHNAAIEAYKALMVGYNTYAQAYDTIIKGEMSKVEVYKAELQGEQVKAQINTNLVEQYKATIQASLSQVEVFKAQVSAAQTLVQLEEAKIGAAGEQIKAYVASINAETAKVEAYKAGVQAEATKVEIYKTQAQAFSAQVGAEAERAKADLGRYTALIQAKTAEWDSYKTRVQAESARIDALGRQSTALLEGFKAEAGAVETQAKLATTVWETQIKEYEASQNIALQSAKINISAYETTRQMATEAAKVAAQTSAQLAGSAMGQYHFNESNGFNRSISYSYSNDTQNAAPTML